MEGHASIDWKYNKDRHVHLLSLWLVIYFSQIRFLVRSMRLPTSADFVFTWQEMKQIRPKMAPLFYGIGPMKTIPDSAIKVVPWYHLEAVFHQYVESNSASCQTPSLHMLPFFIDNFYWSTLSGTTTRASPWGEKERWEVVNNSSLTNVARQPMCWRFRYNLQKHVLLLLWTYNFTLWSHRYAVILKTLEANAETWLPGWAHQTTSQDSPEAGLRTSRIQWWLMTQIFIITQPQKRTFC